QSIEGGVSAALERVTARFPAEGRELPRGGPWRVADHRIESGVVAPLAAAVEECFGKFELPVEEAFAPCRFRNAAPPSLFQSIRQPRVRAAKRGVERRPRPGRHA